MEKKTGFCPAGNMQNIIVSGKMGSGKTKFCKNFCQNSPKIIHMEVDKIGKIFLPLFLAQHKKNFSLCQLQKKLFFSPPHIQNRMWYELESFMHPRMQQKIFSLQKNLFHTSVLLVWDCAIPEKFFTKNFLQKTKQIKISSLGIYPHIFLLKKYRKISSRKIFCIWQRQKN